MIFSNSYFSLSNDYLVKPPYFYDPLFFESSENLNDISDAIRLLKESEF